MNYLLIVLMVTGSLVLGPVLDGKEGGDPWEDGEKGKDAQTLFESGDPWNDGDPWDDRGKGKDDVFESSYGYKTGSSGTQPGSGAAN